MDRGRNAPGGGLIVPSHRRRSRGRVALVLLVLLLEGTGRAAGIPGLEVTGFFRLEPAVSIDGRNPNNRNLDDSARDLNLAHTFGQLELIYGEAESRRLYAKLRWMGEFADDLDRRVEAFDGCPASFRGDGWMLRVSDDSQCAEIWELYGDHRIGNLWLRIGKQQIVWGETLGRRLLDVVNPLDLSWHLFLDPFVEEFDNSRVPEWFLRAVMRVPNPWIETLDLEAIANPGDSIPTLLPDRGSPYNLVPTFVTVKDRPARGHWIGGGRVFGDVAGASVSLAFVSKPVDDAVALSRGAVVDSRFGLPTPAGPSGQTVPLRFLSDGLHPRANIAGGSANAFHQTLGAVFRIEATWTPDQPYQKSPGPGERAPIHIERRSTWRYAASVDRPTRIVPGADPTTILGLTFFETVVEGAPRGVLISGRRVDRSSEQLTFTLSQPFRRKTLYFDFLASWDPDGAYWLQPGARVIHGDHWRLDLFANLLGGSEKRPGRLGALAFADEIVFRVTYGF